MKSFRTKRHGPDQFHPLKHYRVVRKFMAKQQNLTEGELEVLIMLDDEYFTRDRFKEATLTTSWNRDRWNKLVEDGWIELWTQSAYHQKQLFKPTGKSHRLVKRIYKILAGDEDLPMSGRRNPLERKKTENLKYAEKLLKQAVRIMNEKKNNKKFE